MTATAIRRADHRPRVVTPARGRYSRLVGLLRYLLPAIALVLVALVIAWPHLMGGRGSLIVPAMTPAQVDGTDVMMMHRPRYAGQTENAEPYEVVADSAYLDPAHPDRIHLDQLAADLDTDGERDLHLVAGSGLYDRDKDNLDLEGGIELTTTDGYRFETESAWLDLDKGRVVGGRPVAGEGPSGTLRADRFKVIEAGKVLQFEGRVKVKLFLRGAKGASS